MFARKLPEAGGGRGVVLRISTDGVDRRILDIPNNLKIPGNAPAGGNGHVSRLRRSANKVQIFLEIFKAQRFCMGFLGVIRFRDFLGVLLEALGIIYKV